MLVLNTAQVTGGGIFKRQDIPLVEEILGPWETTIGSEYVGYRNHVYRMLNFCFELQAGDDEDKRKLTIAACFHDIGLWIDNTLDYIEPSIPPAMAYIEQQQLECYGEEVTLMISEHHKLTQYTDGRFPLVETFRKADLVDFSCGLVKCGLSKGFVSQVRNEFPNAGFHKNLAKRAGRWFLRHPFNPAPMMKL